MKSQTIKLAELAKDLRHQRISESYHRRGEFHWGVFG
jgi:hypothetical protein